MDTSTIISVKTDPIDALETAVDFTDYALTTGTFSKRHQNRLVLALETIREVVQESRGTGE